MTIEVWHQMMLECETSHELAVALEAAEIASQYLCSRYSQGVNVSVKCDDSLVTDADLKSDELICSHLRSRTSHEIVSEEMGEAFLVRTELAWVVDPLDGTTNFARSVPLFGVSIALFRNGLPVVGVITIPVLKMTFAAVLGCGAWMNGVKLGRNGEQHGRHYVFVNNGYDFPSKMRAAELWKRLGEFCTCRMFGSTAVELCFVASGRANAFVCSGDAVWDYAAGALICAEAGCEVRDWLGREFSWKDSFLLVGDAAVVDEIVPKAGNLQQDAQS